MKLRWKILLVIGLGAAWFWASNAWGQSRRIDLKKYYVGYNEDYFDNTLPDIPVVWGNLSSQNWLGVTFLKEDGTPREIVIDRYAHPYPRQALQTLQHEMCHVSLRGEPDGVDSHGPKHEACMLRLAEKGAMHGIW